jgi:hypothetical protein
VLAKSCLTLSEATRLREELHVLADRFFAEPRSSNPPRSEPKKEPQ